MCSAPVMSPAERELSHHGWRPAHPPRRPVLFINPKSGGGTAARDRVAERARKRGIEAVILAPGHSLAGLVEEALVNGADALGVAGGDGSLAVVAAAAAAHGLPFVCVPAGTRNHFALDVGVDRHDVLGALDAFTDGIERWIDTAEVNGRLFFNNRLTVATGGTPVLVSGTWRQRQSPPHPRRAATTHPASVHIRFVSKAPRQARRPAS